MKKVLTIAGSDCSGGAGIQADLKTITAHKMYAMSAVTALTAQNTTGVYGIMDADPQFVSQQLDCNFTAIIPDAAKIGMVSVRGIIEAIAEKLEEYQAQNVVIDPVMISTSGSRLLSEDAVEVLLAKLLPLGTLVTPNIPEAEVLCRFPISGKRDMMKAAVHIADELHTAVLIKGGHLAGDAADLLYADGSCFWYEGARIDNPNTHGTGCTLSSAIACNLADGHTLNESVKRAKAYLSGALRDGLDLGKGSGPLNHVYQL